MRYAVAAVVLALGLVGCTSGTDEPTTAPPSPPSGSSTSGSTASSSASPAPAPRPPRPPEEGACYRLSYDAAVAPTAGSKPVDCTADHTAQTFHVGELDQLVGGRLLAVDSRQVQAQVATSCPRLLAEQVGGTEEQRRLSMLRSVWFTPTLEESDAGAAWFRCDAVAIAQESRLLPLTGRLSGVLATEAGRDRYGMCGTAEPGTDGFRRVACALTHSWRALRTVDLSGESYPGVEAAKDAGEAPCRDAARAQADDPLDFDWGYEWPTAAQWRQGQIYGICWAPVS